MSIVGIDIGSVSIASVVIETDGTLTAADYRFHQGEIERSLKESFDALGVDTAEAVVRTRNSPDVVRNAWTVDDRVSFMKAASRRFEKLGSLLIVGAETFSIIHFGKDGSYKRLRTNSSCAAGTGSFLDQQAHRLSLTGSGELSRLALSNRGELPKIASRCSVFAKTDLIHAQAEGYSLGEICDGLCLGLAKNITDTLVSDEAPPEPIVFAGGVSKNEAVVKHLEELLHTSISTEENGPVLGAYGAALAYAENEARAPENGTTAAPSVPDGYTDLKNAVRSSRKERDYYYDPLSLELSTYPNFAGEESFVYSTEAEGTEVETDIYTSFSKGTEAEVHLGIDIGSTSTKAVLSAPSAEVYAGFYTRTAGKPMKAVRAIFQTIRYIEEYLGIRFSVLSAATTGSGRKFIGRVIGADIIMDEITAHARAAYQLDSRIDTIVEIGGQDSKFTTMRDGMVTFSKMNTICAAGTGSFLEEQAQKLGVPLSEYSERAERHPAPLTSDRCTVFMERDINNYLNQDYTVNEVLAAALFSVRENYLQKVSTEAHLGEHVCFQGATAKNRALVAAFEQKLGRPIFVSKYCHLTGALGAALIAEEEGKAETSFRGLDIYKREIPVRTETCDLCTNHCRIRIAEVEGETVAFGFLCGRDYETKHYVDRNISGFDLVKTRRKIFRDASKAGRLTYGDEKKREDLPLFGLPVGLHMVEDLPLWKHFFAELGFPFITSEKMESPIKRGKELTGAEFCAPMTAFHGHTDYIAEHADIPFLPVYLQAKKESHEEDKSRKYCYYTQYAPSLTTAVEKRRMETNSLNPLIKPGHFRHNITELYRILSPYMQKKSALIDITRAYSSAHQYQEVKAGQLKEVFEREFFSEGTSAEEGSGPNNPNKLNYPINPVEPESPKKQGGSFSDIHVVLVGRPYTVLSPSMNNRIPEIFGTMGVKTYFQDMLPDDPSVREDIEPILSAFHWHYAADILEAAAYAARTPGLYPVYITSFKCSPDSFAVDYFTRILDAKGKPYLILQLDEHDSSVGYETRIEAGVRAFHNHLKREQEQEGEIEPAAAENPQKAEENGSAEQRADGKVKEQSKKGEEKDRAKRVLGVKIPSLKIKKEANPVIETELDGKTLLFPNWDSITNPLLVANLRREGVDARILHENPTSIQKSMRLNTGQCLPVSIIAQESMDYVREHTLDPARTALWMAQAKVACNIPMYPYYIKNVFEDEGGGMEKMGVYLGDLSHMEISPKVAIYAYFAYMFGGLLRKLGCRIRPYETEKGETDKAVKRSFHELEEAFLGNRPFDKTIERIIWRFEEIPTAGDEKPKVAVFGDLYVRDNDTMNQDLIRTIEEAGGEVITTPYNEYAKIISHAYFHKWFKDRRYLTWLKNRSLLAAVGLVEKRYYSYFKEFFSPGGEPTKGQEIEDRLSAFNLTTEHDGESMENVLKIFHILEEHDDVALFVQASPSYCCPALVTEAMNRDIERITGVPVVSITYDGTGTPQNDRVVPYLAYRSGKSARKSTAEETHTGV
ncbi:MAG: acyl-CoA dehydratase activase [Spirochaetia bacterium]